MRRSLAALALLVAGCGSDSGPPPQQLIPGRWEPTSGNLGALGGLQMMEYSADSSYTETTSQFGVMSGTWSVSDGLLRMYALSSSSGTFPLLRSRNVHFAVDDAHLTWGYANGTTIGFQRMP